MATVVVAVEAEADEDEVAEVADEEVDEDEDVDGTAVVAGVDKVLDAVVVELLSAFFFFFTNNFNLNAHVAQICNECAHDAIV